MPARKVILLFIALLIAGATIMLTRSNVAPQTDGTTSIAGPDSKPHNILVVSGDLPAGSLIKDSDVRWEGWATEEVPEGYIVKDRDNKDDYVGGVIRYGMHDGEPLKTNLIMKTGDRGFMAAVLSPGMRAVAVSLSPTAGVAGFIFPGDRVDVIMTHQISLRGGREEKPHKISETILTDVRILALDQETDDQNRTPVLAKTATLEVTPKQAERLALVPEMGLLALSLRSLANAPLPANQNGSMTWDSDVSGVVSHPANRKGRIQHIQIMRGQKKTESVFELHQ